LLLFPHTPEKDRRLAYACQLVFAAPIEVWALQTLKPRNFQVSYFWLKRSN